VIAGSNRHDRDERSNNTRDANRADIIIGPVIRIANAPCSWGALEFASDAVSAPYGIVLDEIRETGYAGTELGDWGFMPTDPEHLRDEVAKRSLELIGAFVPVGLADASTHDDGVASAVRTARLMRDAGALDAFIVLSDDNGSVAARERNAGRITASDGLSESGRVTFAKGAERVARAVRDVAGLRTVFHPHCGGYIETPGEIDDVMRRTDPSLLGLVLDTGHIMYGGGDPVRVLHDHIERVWHVHFKDCDLRVAEEARARSLGYLAAVRAQLFCELGAGGVDFGQVVSVLKSHGYQGWIVVEQDVFPGYGTPKESARRSREYLRALGL
jgi:inosose dehydratase